MRSYGDYYYWLLGRIEAVPGAFFHNYQSLCQTLYQTDYIWILVLDENRACAGIALRDKFAYETGIDANDVDDGPCSVLEMLVALAETMSEIYGDNISRWFWEMMSNINLDHFSDDNFDSHNVKVILTTWLERRYSSKGTGSIFPVKHMTGDARTIQVWDMMNIYMDENYPTDENWLDS